MPCALLALILLSAPALAQPAVAAPAGAFQVELTAGEPKPTSKVRLRAGRATTFLLDTPLLEETVRLQEIESFEGFSLDKSGKMLTVVAPRAARPGKSFTLWGRFKGEDTPAELTLLLEVAHEGEDTVWVRRFPSSAALLQAELEKEKERNQQLEAENARLQAAADELTGLLGVAAMRGADGKELISFDIGLEVLSGRGQRLDAAYSYRARDAVAVKLQFQDLEGRETRWVGPVEMRCEDGAALRLEKVWERTGTGTHIVVVVGVEPSLRPQASCQLLLREAEGPRSLLFQGIRLP